MSPRYKQPLDQLASSQQATITAGNKTIIISAAIALPTLKTSHLPPQKWNNQRYNLYTAFTQPVFNYLPRNAFKISRATNRSYRLCKFTLCSALLIFILHTIKLIDKHCISLATDKQHINAIIYHLCLNMPWTAECRSTVAALPSSI